MATLTEVSGVARKTIKWTLIGMVSIAMAPLVYRFGLALYKILNPPPPAAPTVRYGKLPKLQFPPDSGAPAPTYKLETIEGSLPKLAATSKVYLVGINKSRLLTIDRIKTKITPLGYLPDAQELDEKNYRFFNPNIQSEVIYNIVAEGFSYSYDWTKERDLYNLHSMATDSKAVALAKNFFNTYGSLPADVNTGMGKTTYFIASGSAMVPTDYSYQANLTRVDLFRSDKDKMHVVTAGVTTSPINAVLSSLEEKKQVVQANFQYSKVLDNDFATYPLIGVQKAWEYLQAGKAYIAKRTVDNVTIRKVSLAYYESNDPQEFLQPVYVFEGDNGFTAYVQAVREDYEQ